MPPDKHSITRVTRLHRSPFLESLFLTRGEREREKNYAVGMSETLLSTTTVTDSWKSIRFESKGRDTDSTAETPKAEQGQAFAT